MRILVITEEFGQSATGLVVENIVKGLVQHCNVDVLTDKYNPKDVIKCNVIVRKKISKTKIQTLSIKNLGIDILSHWWCVSVPRDIRKKYDLIFSVVSYGHLAPLWVGRRMKSKYGGKFFAYFVDAVPAPQPFLKDQLYVDRLSKYINQYCDNVEVIFSTTKEMSNYQANIIENPNIQFVELFNPTKTNDLITLPKTDKSKNGVNNIIFTYTGNIYPPRNPKYLLEAFTKFLHIYPNAQLHIIGNRIINYLDSYIEKLPTEVQGNIKSLPFQSDLYEAFIKSTALIDIGCELDMDVYMSNKINGYFSYCRPIICETSSNSPAARIFKDMETVIICNHDAEDIYNAMVHVSSDEADFDYSERYSILKEMSINGVTQKIMNCYYGK